MNTSVLTILDKLLYNNDKALVNHILNFVVDTCCWCDNKSHCINICNSCDEKYCRNCSSTCNICYGNVCNTCIYECCLCQQPVCQDCCSRDKYHNKYCSDC